MSLSKLGRFKVNTNIGYSVVHKNKDVFTSLFNYPDENTTYLENKWHTAFNKIITTAEGLPYKSGFHLFLDLKDAVSYREKRFVRHKDVCIAQVKFKDILYVGYKRISPSDYMAKVVVVNKRKIIGVVKYVLSY